MAETKLGVALGSGGARGLAHIGVLKALQEMNVPIDCVAGSSMGSMIAAFYANQMDLDMIAKLLSSLKKKHWLDLTVPTTGLITGDKIRELVKLLTRGKNIEDLALPISIVATDLEAGERVVFRQGPIYKAVRASCSIPGIFTPERYDGRLLIDGGVIERVPIEAVKEMGADYTVAVDVGAQKSKAKIDTLFDVIAQTIDIMEAEIVKNRIIHADIVIRPRVGHIGVATFDKVEECIEEGYRAAYEHQQEISEIVKLYWERRNNG